MQGSTGSRPACGSALMAFVRRSDVCAPAKRGWGARPRNTSGWILYHGVDVVRAGAISLLSHYWVGNTQLVVFDEPADGFKDGLFGLVPRRVPEETDGLVDLEAVAAGEVVPAGLRMLCRGGFTELVPGDCFQPRGFPEPAGGDVGVSADVECGGGDDVEVLTRAAISMLDGP